VDVAWGFVGRTSVRARQMLIGNDGGPRGVCRMARHRRRKKISGYFFDRDRIPLTLGVKLDPSRDLGNGNGTLGSGFFVKGGG